MAAGTPFVLQGAAASWPICRAAGGVASAVQTAAALLSPAVSSQPVPVTVLPARAPGPNLDGTEAYALESTPTPLVAAIKQLDMAQPHASAGSGTHSHHPVYIKNWHFALDAPAAAAGVYSVPLPFADDLLNAWFDSAAVSDAGVEAGEAASSCPPTAGASAGEPSDYRFCYAGSGGSWTPLHHDVLYSCSWSASVAGYKLWLFIPPEGSLRHLYDAWGGVRFASVLTRAEMDAVAAAVAAAAEGDAARCGSSESTRSSTAVDRTSDSARHGISATGAASPVCSDCQAAAAASAAAEAASFVERDAVRAALSGSVQYAIQPPGSAIFVPPGWHHEVHNITSALSLNHNWFSPLVGLRESWAFLRREVNAARASIADCKASAAAAHGCGGRAGTGLDSAVSSLELLDTARESGTGAASGETSVRTAVSEVAVAAPAAEPVDWEWEGQVQFLTRLNSGFCYDQVCLTLHWSCVAVAFLAVAIAWASMILLLSPHLGYVACVTGPFASYALLLAVHCPCPLQSTAALGGHEVAQ
jgi:hypothetical protein